MSVSRWLQRSFLKFQASKSPVEDVVNIGLVSVATDEILSFMGKRWRMHQLYYSDSKLWCNFRVFSKFETDDWGVMQVFIRRVGRSRLPVRGGCGWRRLVARHACSLGEWLARNLRVYGMPENTAAVQWCLQYTFCLLLSRLCFVLSVPSLNTMPVSLSFVAFFAWAALTFGYIRSRFVVFGDRTKVVLFGCFPFARDSLLLCLHTPLLFWCRIPANTSPPCANLQLWACGRAGMFSTTNMYCMVHSVPCMKVESTDLRQKLEKGFARVALDLEQRSK